MEENELKRMKMVNDKLFKKMENDGEECEEFWKEANKNLTYGDYLQLLLEVTPKTILNMPIVEAMEAINAFDDMGILGDLFEDQEEHNDER